jgi:hypothetical protein
MTAFQSMILFSEGAAMKPVGLSSFSLKAVKKKEGKQKISYGKSRSFRH